MNKHGVETGKIKFFNRDKGFGFIKNDNESEIFFHITECHDYLPKQEDRVEFTIGEGKKGEMAKNVTPTY